MTSDAPAMGMVERLARVLQVKRASLYVVGDDEWDDLAPRARFVWMECARAAIAAMRDPTPEMEAAGEILDDWGVPSDPGQGQASALAHWTAMIDAALREPTDA